MRLISLLGNSQKLDGGAMFGNAPKALWQQWLEPNEQNQITLACRCLLVQSNNHNILLETGVGAFFEPKLKERYGVQEEDHILLHSLKTVGLSDSDIDIVVLSHLHFDHAGGLLSAWKPEESPRLLFPNATYLVSAKAWERANEPHGRDRASFVPLLNQQLEQSGRLNIIDETSSILGSNFTFHCSNGHTPGMMLTKIRTPKGPVLFAADLIPGVPWVHLPITMGYDRFPELVIDEKQQLLEQLVKDDGYLFFTHDPQIALAKVCYNAKNQFTTVDLQTSIDLQF